jgi:FAD/FMN-containing dehydrogenase
VNFARENDLRLVVKGGGHSYQGTSNAPDSLLIWARHMNDIAMHTAFVPQGCEHVLQPQPAVTLGAGTIGMQAYNAVTTKAGKYIQGGGCTTVGLPGLIQGGGFGSHSKHYGTAAGNLLEAEVVTADGQIRIANASTNPHLFWALKGGGGGTYGVSKLRWKGDAGQVGWFIWGYESLWLPASMLQNAAQERLAGAIGCGRPESCRAH